MTFQERMQLNRRANDAAWAAQVDATHCNICERVITDPIEDADGEAVCLDCFTERQDRYRGSFDDLLGNPMEQLNGLGVRS